MYVEAVEIATCHITEEKGHIYMEHTKEKLWLKKNHMNLGQLQIWLHVCGLENALGVNMTLVHAPQALWEMSY